MKGGEDMEEILLAAATSADIFAAVLGLMASGIRLKVPSAAVVVIIGSFIMWGTVRFSGLLCGLIPLDSALVISKTVLLLLGIHTLFADTHKRNTKDKNGLLSCTKIISEPAAADCDGSKTISPAEGIMMGAALSADSFFTGISAGLGGISAARMFLFSLIFGSISCAAGIIAGLFLRSRLTPGFPAGRISGLLLIMLALSL